LLVSDRDLLSKHDTEFKWTAFLQHGTVTRLAPDRYQLAFGPLETVSSLFGYKNRGMELSEVVVFDDRLFAMCDISGIVYELDLATRSVTIFSQHMFPGEGLTNRPFKIEWATTKDGELLLGSLGKEWVQDERIIGYGPQYIKRLSLLPDRSGFSVTDESWVARFEQLRALANASFPGYMIHEAVEWDALNRRWLIMPRRISPHMYDPKADEYMGANLLFVASEDFSDIQVHRVGPLEPEWGFTSLAILPGTQGRHLLVVKAQEADDVTATKLTVIDDHGHLLLDPTAHPSGWAHPTLEPTAKYE
jgi:soluble calcium-activated nucleotidase 1